MRIGAQRLGYETRAYRIGHWKVAGGGPRPTFEFAPDPATVLPGMFRRFVDRVRKGFKRLRGAA